MSLDYIGRFETATATTLVDRIEAIAETGQTGFHFVDEAAPPKCCAPWPKNSSGARWHQLVGQHPV